MQINRLWTVMLTRESGNSDTDSSIHESVNTNGVERLNHTFPDTRQTDQERGIANLYHVDVTDNGIQTEQLTDSSIRLGINETTHGARSMCSFLAKVSPPPE